MTIVGPGGKVYAVWPQAYAREATGDVATLQKLAADKYYGNVVTQVQPTSVLTAPEPLDVEPPDAPDGDARARHAEQFVTHSSILLTK